MASFSTWTHGMIMKNSKICNKTLPELVVAIKGAGDLASGVAGCLFQANFRKLFMMEIPEPLSIRRGVCFSEAIRLGRKTVEDVEAVRTDNIEGIHEAWQQSQIPVLVDPQWSTIKKMCPHAVVDAIMAKRNLGTSLDEAPLVIGLGPGFNAGKDVHRVVETNRGHDQGRIILSGAAEPDTGVPGQISGYSSERVIRAPAQGRFNSRARIGDFVRSGDVIGDVGGREVCASIDGVVRGLMVSGANVKEGLKLGDIDPRGNTGYCNTISDKSRAIGGAVVGAILQVYNR